MDNRFVPDQEAKISFGGIHDAIRFVTGGVVSSLGKGIAAASLAALLEARGLRVTLMKLDPYINVDPGTIGPFSMGSLCDRRRC